MGFSTQINAQTRQEILQSAEDLLYATRLEESTEELRKSMKVWNKDEFSNQLDSDTLKLAFWLNIYNAVVQDELTKNPDNYKKRNNFFKTKSIDIAGIMLSPDDIEHGILRRSSLKLSLGYLHKFFPSKQEKIWRIEKIDPRIHFALNCGAASCPAINWYSSDKINAQLNEATKSYLNQTIILDKATKIVILPKLFSWFRGDFGGKIGIIDFIRTHYSTEITKDYSLKYLDYSWTLKLDSYRN